MLTAVLAGAALAAGVTGAWSPCGFSMVETLAPHGYAGRARTTALACVTFPTGALAGAVATFGGLALIGRAVGVAAPAAAAIVALAAAIGEARGARIVPQVRRQVPESWRRVLPVPVAAGLYGVLLGLGFTTFILSFAVWALAGIAVALGEPGLGLAMGLGFGLGRALPVVALAPSGGGRAAAAMAERPGILRALRGLDSAALAACAAVLIAAPAQAATVVAFGATDPSVDGNLVALHRPGRAGELLRGGVAETAPGAHPAVGGGRLAWISGPTVQVAGFPPISAPGSDAVAVSAHWVAWRVGEALFAAPLGGRVEQVVAAGAGRPALIGTRLLFDVRERRLEEIDLSTGAHRVLRAPPTGQVRAPSATGNRLVYVRATYKRQRVMSGPLDRTDARRDRSLYSTFPTGRRDRGFEKGHRHARGHHQKLWPRPKPGVADTLWTTAAAPHGKAFVTRLRQRAGQPLQYVVLRVPR